MTHPAPRRPDGGGRTGATSAEQRLPPPKKKSEDPSGSIRDITAHLIHYKNTSIAIPCIVFNEESAGYNPGKLIVDA